jgi:hypothetical protein
MMRSGTALALSLSIIACSGSPKEEPKEEPNPRPGFSDDGEAAKGRIGAYLQNAVVDSDMRTCWGQLKGEGAVAADLTYRKGGSNWTFESATVKGSNLGEDQKAAAQRCLEESAKGTSFAVDSKETLETNANVFVVRLGWPVPLPPQGEGVTDEYVARMVSTGGTGITISGCSTCELRGEPPYGYKCVSKSSGSETDCDEISTNVCAVTPKACLRGAFGGTRGVIMW